VRLLMAHSLLLCAKTSKDFVACTALFAGKPAPTGIMPSSKAVHFLWERVYPRMGQYR